MIDIPAYLKYALQLLLTPNGLLAVAGLTGIIWLGRIIVKKMEIPGLTVEVLPQESWFVHRDDNHRFAAVISLQFTNRSGKEIRIRKARFSGYAPKTEVPPILLQGRQTSVPLPFPEYERCDHDREYCIAPFATQKTWLYYESGSIDLRNRMNAPLVLRSADGKRTSVRVELTRHPHQIQLYREQWI